jgi:hypothetical protein
MTTGVSGQSDMGLAQQQQQLLLLLTGVDMSREPKQQGTHRAVQHRQALDS